MRKIYDLFSRVYRKTKTKTLVVLGILGSPREGGNSDILLTRALEGAQSLGARAEKIVLNNLSISPCQACEEAGEHNNCRVEDDMQELYPKIQEADIIIICSPVFFGSVSAQTKIMVDRFQCWWQGKYILKEPVQNKIKSGAFISVQAQDKPESFDNARGIIRNFFATIDTEYREELFCPEVEEKGIIAEDRDCLSRAYDLGQKLVQEVKV